MLEKVYERIAEYEKRVAYLKGQSDTGGTQYVSKTHLAEIETLQNRIAEMKQIAAEFESQFCEDFPSFTPATPPKAARKTAKKEPDTRSKSGGTGCLLLIVIGMILAFVLFLVMINQHSA